MPIEIKNKNKYISEILLYSLSAILTTIIILIYLYTHAFHLRTPIRYDQDNLFSLALVKGIIEHGFSVQNLNLGAPFISDLSDFPMSESTNIFIIKILSFVSHNPIIVTNLFFLLSFVLISITALFVFRQLGLDKSYALTASILFSFMPYHFLRMEVGHLFLIAFYAVPIYVWLSIQVLTKPLFFRPKDEKRKPTKTALIFGSYAFICFLIASSGIYYAFFGGFFFVIAGIIGSIDKKHFYPVINAIILSFFIIASILINTLPSIISHAHQGPNVETAQRAPFEAELYGLKITQLLLPTDRYRVSHIANFKKNYNDTAPLINENKTSSIGVIASAGFLFLLVILFLSKNIAINKTLFNLSRFNYAAILLCTIGGFSSLFSYLISPMIRCYNRISIFIAFIGLAAFFLCIQLLVKKQFFKLIPSVLGWFIAIAILMIGLFDQIPHMMFSVPDSSFVSDTKFVSAMDKLMPKNSMIMQLPYIPFPESPDVYGMHSYSLLRGYINSQHLHWSFGAMRGRQIAAWQQALATQTPSDILNNLAYAGFTGLYLFKKGFADNGILFEKQLSEHNIVPSVENDEHDLVFYDLRPYISTLQNSMTLADWHKHQTMSQDSFDALTNLNIVWGKGFYTLEQDKNNSWRWGKAAEKLDIYVINHPIRATIKFTVKTGYPSNAHLWITSDVINKKLDINSVGQTINENIYLSKGKHSIYFKTDGKQLHADPDPRQLFLMISDFSFTTTRE